MEKSTPLIIKEIDKANHFIVGSVLACIAGATFSLLVAVVIVTAIAALKEVRDMIAYNRTKFDLADFGYTLAGAFPVILLLIIKSLW